MALPVLDGNQTATTLSSVVTGGEHIVAHSVVSLGSTAISNITTAVSGSTVCVGNLGLLQSTVGTEGISASVNFIKIGGHTGSATTGNIVHVSSLGAMKVDGSSYTQPVFAVTVPATVCVAGKFEMVTTPETGINLGNNLPQNLATGIVPVVIINDEGRSVNDTDTTALRVNGSQFTQPISGTVTAGLADVTDPAQDSGTSAKTVAVKIYNVNGIPISDFYRFPISGSVTIGAGISQIGTVTVGNSVTIGSCVTHGVTIANTSVTVNGTFYQATQPVSLASVPTHGVTLASTTVTVSSLPALAAGTAQIGSVTASISGTVPVSISSVTVGNSVTIGSIPAISGTVTANSSNGSLTTRFGSVTTANTAFATSAVTNANRKYLLIQNVTTASNVITVGIGFTPTTTQGIQLTAGAGLTFDGFYIPTGAVNILSSVTASTFTILEA